MPDADQELGQLASGEWVFDRHRSHVHGPVRDLLAEALRMVASGDRDVVIEQVDLGRIVGKRLCVKTTKSDEIVYVRRPHRKGLTRFVKGREPEDSSSVVVILKRIDYADTYICLSAYIGTHSEPEPWDRNATAASTEFWRSHALIWDEDEIFPETDAVDSGFKPMG